MPNIQEALGLLDNKVLENSPTTRKLLDEFETMLPPHFGKPYIVQLLLDLILNLY